MNIWKRLFAKHGGDPAPNPTVPTCPFCGVEATEQSISNGGYPVWRSQCGALGSGSSMYPDLDEVADGLLNLLGFAGTVSEPGVPADDSGMITMQRYDIPKSLNRLQEILSQHNYEMRTNDWKESGDTIYSVWVCEKVT